jgi:hypothetical protein
MITHAQLLNKLRYDPNTGEFYRRSDNGVAGTTRKDGRKQINLYYRIYFAHRLAWFYVHGEWPSEIDHINCDHGDNRLANLRIVSRTQNLSNTRKPKHNSSGYKGVYRASRGGRWVAALSVNNYPKYLGTYDTPEEAHEAYQEAAKRLRGEFARFV